MLIDYVIDCEATLSFVLVWWKLKSVDKYTIPANNIAQGVQFVMQNAF